jgi:hypothetical protein
MYRNCNTTVVFRLYNPSFKHGSCYVPVRFLFRVRKVEDTNIIIRNNTDKDRQYNGQNNKGQRDKQ